MLCGMSLYCGGDCNYPRLTPKASCFSRGVCFSRSLMRNSHLDTKTIRVADHFQILHSSSLPQIPISADQDMGWRKAICSREFLDLSWWLHIFTKVHVRSQVIVEDLSVIFAIYWWLLRTLAGCSNVSWGISLLYDRKFDLPFYYFWKKQPKRSL